MKRDEAEPNVPADLRKVIAAAPEAKAQWNGLTPLARQDFIMWIDSAKQSETRKRRIESVPNRLASGKRRPCCFAIVPLDLHKVLAGLPKAKAQWSKLGSLERRNLYHFCVSLFSLRDWVFSEFSGKPEWSYGATISAFQQYLEAQCPEFAIVSDVANSAKHRLLDRNRSGVTGSNHVSLYGDHSIGGVAIGDTPKLEVLVGNKIYPLLYTAEKSLFMWRRHFAENNWD